MTSPHCLRLVVLAVPAAMLVACAQPAYVPTDTAAPPLPEAEYRQAALDGEPVYRIDTEVSRVFVWVRRGGAMKTAGHDHIVASEHVEGFVLAGSDFAEARANLRLPLQQLVVDRPEYRERFGLDSDLSESARNGTTRNMQDKVLESEQFPWAEVAARFAADDLGQSILGVSIVLHGTSFDYLVPVNLSVDEQQLLVEGSMSINHADFGLTPYSAAGGLLRVAEAVEIYFELNARRWVAVN